LSYELLVMSEKKSIIKDKSFAFAVRIVRLYQHLCNNKKEYVLSKQLLRSGTAVGALVREAQNAESKADFIHKLGIAQKECDESIYWIELMKETEYLTQIEFESINNEALELLKMLRSAIITSKKNNSKLIIHNL
jgi:four helix bundle protein